MSDNDSTPTSEAHVEAYGTTRRVFDGLFDEMKELSKKKPDGTLNKVKVTLINRVLSDLNSFLAEEPEAKYLETLDDETLPQNSDAVLIMVQYGAALRAFRSRHYGYDPESGENGWLIGTDASTKI